MWAVYIIAVVISGGSASLDICMCVCVLVPDNKNFMMKTCRLSQWSRNQVCTHGFTFLLISSLLGWLPHVFLSYKSFFILFSSELYELKDLIYTGDGGWGGRIELWSITKRFFMLFLVGWSLGSIVLSEWRSCANLHHLVVVTISNRFQILINDTMFTMVLAKCHWRESI